MPAYTVDDIVRILLTNNTRELSLDRYFYDTLEGQIGIISHIRGLGTDKPIYQVKFSKLMGGSNVWEFYEKNLEIIFST